MRHRRDFDPNDIPRWQESLERAREWAAPDPEEVAQDERRASLMGVVVGVAIVAALAAVGVVLLVWG